MTAELRETEHSTIVLVADDDPATRMHISRNLVKQGYHILTAANGKEALEQVQNQAPDMVLLDIAMPEVDGYQVLQSLKSDPMLRSIPVIMISAAGDVDKVVRCIEMGAEDCLVKPLNDVLLKARISAYLERKHLRDQEQAYLHQLQVEKAAAEVAHRTKNAFLANMSHELRTPLNAILGYSEILQEELKAESKTELISDLDRIYNSGKHLLELVDGILDLAKIESGTMEVSLEKFDIKTLASGLIETIRPLALANQNTLNIHCNADVGMMYSDMNKVHQILHNLLDNAVKFTEKGIITLTIERSQNPTINYKNLETRNLSLSYPHPIHPFFSSASDWITFRITDTGIGILPEQQQRIFSGFTQADESSTRKYGGAGLGLTLSQRFCHLLGGSIAVESQVDRGSTFTVHLPAKVNPIHRNTNHKTKQTESNKESIVQTVNISESDLILVIDDDRIVRDLMVQTFNQAGYRVVTSWQAAEGLRLARELLPGLIILDMQLSGMDSWAVLSALKDNATLAEIPVILQALPASLQSDSSQPKQSESSGFVLGICDRLTTPEEFKRWVVQLQSFRSTVTNSTVTNSTATNSTAINSISATTCCNSANNVLLIQNDPALSKVVHWLTEAGWNVITAPNYQKALEFLPSGLTDVRVIVLDLMLPDLESFQFLVRLQQTGLDLSVPVVSILTTALTAIDRQHLKQGVNYVLQHSFPDLPLLPQIRNTVFRYLPPLPLPLANSSLSNS